LASLSYVYLHHHCTTSRRSLSLIASLSSACLSSGISTAVLWFGAASPRRRCLLWWVSRDSSWRGSWPAAGTCADKRLCRCCILPPPPYRHRRRHQHHTAIPPPPPPLPPRDRPTTATRPPSPPPPPNPPSPSQPPPSAAAAAAPATAVTATRHHAASHRAS
jgi:hypothetical protein